MNSRNKSIVLVDSQLGMNSDWFKKMNVRKGDVVILDPVNLFSAIDWTCYEENVNVINKVYAELFEEVVMNDKKFVCFWPLAEQLGEDWFDLVSLCQSNSYELEVYKSGSIVEVKYGFNQELLSSWNRFVYFLIESLLADIRLNEQFDEIATLKSDQKTIVLFKWLQEGNVKFSFGLESEFFDLEPNYGDETSKIHQHLQYFDSFNEMLEKLLKENDLSLFESKFIDGSLEKTYFSVLAKEFKTTNLIEYWLKTYSLN